MNYLDPDSGLAALLYCVGSATVIWSGALSIRLLRTQRGYLLKDQADHLLSMAKIDLSREEALARHAEAKARQAQYDASDRRQQREVERAARSSRVKA